MKRYSLYAYDPGDHCLSISKEVDMKYGEWVKYNDVEPILSLLGQYLEECEHGSADPEEMARARDSLRRMMKA